MPLYFQDESKSWSLWRPCLGVSASRCHRVVSLSVHLFTAWEQDGVLRQGRSAHREWPGCSHAAESVCQEPSDQPGRAAHSLAEGKSGCSRRFTVRAAAHHCVVGCWCSGVLPRAWAQLDLFPGGGVQADCMTGKDSPIGWFALYLALSPRYGFHLVITDDSCWASWQERT